MKRFLFSLTLGLASFVAFTQCTTDRPITAPQPITRRAFEFELNPEKLLTKCDAALKRFEDSVAKIGNLAPEQVTVENTLLELERAQSELSDEAGIYYFMTDVGENEGLRAKGKECSERLGKAQLKVFSDPKTYKALLLLKEKSGKALGKDERDILEEHLREFKINGTELVLKGDPRAAEFKRMSEELVTLKANFKEGAVKNYDTIPLTKKKLLDAGITEEDVELFVKMDKGQPVKDDAGNLVYEFKGANPVQWQTIMENSKDAQLRHDVDEAWESKGGPKNLELLKTIITYRDKMAKMLGYANHAEMRVEKKMAKTPEAVLKFLDDVRTKLLPLGEQNLEELTAAKRKETGDKNAKLDYWDWRYYETRLRETVYQVDMNEVKQYFPLDTVTKGLFTIYQTLLGVKFEPDSSYKTWFSDVKLYRIVENGRTLAYFFMDLHPREGKRTGAAAYTLIEPRVLPDGSYQAPVSSIVANFNKPTAGKPSLLTHDQVVTYFHEFGHIMHQTLSTVKYRTFAGSNTKQDYWEAPSQMLENWVWNKQGLELLSGRHDNPEKKLPDNLLKQLTDSKYANSGIFYLRQIALATADMTYHTNADVDLLKTWKEIFKKTMLLDVHEKGALVMGFTHITGSYDAGYYGYLWSKRYAEDMFTRFQHNLLDSRVGADYRKWILEPGGTQEPLVLIEGFLGRPVQNGPFETSLGLGQLSN
jgi:thimet oligopeptidase